jgi:hypothetical protein
MPSQDREQNTRSNLEHVLVAHPPTPLSHLPGFLLQLRLAAVLSLGQAHTTQRCKHKNLDLSAIPLLVGWLGYYEICQNRTEEIILEYFRIKIRQSNRKYITMPGFLFSFVFNPGRCEQHEAK